MSKGKRFGGKICNAGRYMVRGPAGQIINMIDQQNWKAYLRDHGLRGKPKTESALLSWKEVCHLFHEEGEEK